MLRLREIRDSQGVSRAKLSRLSGVKASTIGMLELGKREYPRLDTAMQLARALGCTVDELLCEEDGDEKQGG